MTPTLAPTKGVREARRDGGKGGEKGVKTGDDTEELQKRISKLRYKTRLRIAVATLVEGRMTEVMEELMGFDEHEITAALAEIGKDKLKNMIRMRRRKSMGGGMTCGQKTWRVKTPEPR